MEQAVFHRLPAYVGKLDMTAADSGGGVQDAMAAKTEVWPLVVIVVLVILAVAVSLRKRFGGAPARDPFSPPPAH